MNFFQSPQRKSLELQNILDDPEHRLHHPTQMPQQLLGAVIPHAAHLARVSIELCPVYAHKAYLQKPQLLRY